MTSHTISPVQVAGAGGPAANATETAFKDAGVEFIDARDCANRRCCAARSATSSLSRFAGDTTEVHHCGDESAWWEKAGIDPSASARALWLKSHPLPQHPSNDIVQSDSGTTAS
jgi:hypothetical protein